jgi:hypothetical protein
MKAVDKVGARRVESGGLVLITSYAQIPSNDITGQPARYVAVIYGDCTVSHISTALTVITS